ncbi:MAG TPA: histidine kinase [Solirubrobacterales bacterium]|nr:histidine kinase [Solirubrobacterales bacterium]
MLGLDRSSQRLRALTEHGPNAVGSSPAPGSSRYRLLDAGVVLAVLAVSLVQLASHVFVDDDVAGELDDPDVLGVVLVLLTSLPLFWRRRHPWAVMAIAGGGGIALVACGYSVNVPAALFVALYTFAASGRGATWPPIAFAGLLFVAQVVVEIAVLSLSIEDYLIPALLLAGAWVFGERRHTAALREAEEHERREREERLSIAEERTRIARELHDSAGHAINTILVQAGAARVLRERDPERSQEAIEAIERLALETIEDIDRIVGSLRAEGPAERAPLPGIERIPDLVAEQRRAGLEVELRELADDWRKPPPAVDRAAYRIAQEALTNAARHGSGRVELTLHQHVDRLELIVVNPIAAAPAPARPGGGGLGLIGMRERAQLLGGFLEAGPVDGRFRVRAVFPYSWIRE